MVAHRRNFNRVDPVLIAAAAVLALTAWPQETKKSPEVMVPMRDGVRLATNVHLPDGAGPWPTVLTRTPYGKDRDAEPGFTSRQYARVLQDIRGQNRSEGKYRPWLDDVADGYDTVEWIARQPWSNGKVGMVGGSASAILANLAALGAPPHLTCLFVTKSFPSSYQYASYPGGVFLEDMNDKWLSARGLKPTPGPR